MAWTQRERDQVKLRWWEWRRVMDDQECMPLYAVGAKPGPIAGTASFRFVVAPEARAHLPRLLREAADALDRQAVAGGPVILTPAAGSGEGGGA